MQSPTAANEETIAQFLIPGTGQHSFSLLHCHSGRACGLTVNLGSLFQDIGGTLDRRIPVLGPLLSIEMPWRSTMSDCINTLQRLGEITLNQILYDDIVDLILVLLEYR
jgi:hypothetical protein